MNEHTITITIRKESIRVIHNEWEVLHVLRHFSNETIMDYIVRCIETCSLTALSDTKFN